MRCPDCNKWPQLEAGDPEVNVELDGDSITGTARIVLNCANCGTEIKAQEFDVEQDISDLRAKHACPNEDVGEGWHVDAAGENTYRQHPPNARRRRTYYGVEVTLIVSCNCEEEDKVEETYQLDFEVQASHMEELI